MADPLDLRDLRAFLAVADERSIRRAAGRLHISQPPLSRRLRDLEDRLGTRLLERDRTGVALTPSGLRLREHAQRVVQEVDALVEAMRQRDRLALLRVAVSPVVPVADLERLALAWREEFRGRIAEVPRDGSPAILDAVREGRLDFGVVGLPGDTTGLVVRAMFREPLLAALPQSHPAARKRAVHLRDLAGLPFFWMARSSNPAFHAACAREFALMRFKPRYVVVEPGSLLTLERIVRGEGFTLMNSRIRARVRGVAYREIAGGERLAIEVACVWKAGDIDAHARRLAKLARRMLHSPANG